MWVWTPLTPGGAQLLAGGGTPVDLDLGQSDAVSGATCALTAKTQVSCQSSDAVSSATLAVTAPTQVPLQTSDATSGATLALTAPTQLPLGASDAASGATLAITAPTAVPLGSSDAVSAATLTFIVGARILAATVPAQSGTGWFHLDAYNPYADAVVANTATYYWRFEEQDVARDHGAFGDIGVRSFDGTYVNTPTFGPGAVATAATETAVTFAAASSERVSAPATGLGSSLDTATITFFVKSSTTAQEFLLGAVNSGSGSSNVTALAIEANSNATGGSSAGSTRFLLTDNAGAETRCHITTSLYDGAWHHVVAVVGASGWEIYVDGVGVTESSASGTPGTYNDFNVDLDLGALNFQGAHTGYFDGTLDEVAIFGTRFSEAGAAILNALRYHILPLQSIPAQSAATLALTATTKVALGQVDAVSTATCEVEAEVSFQEVPCQPSDAVSGATLALTAPTRVPLGQVDALAAATLALSAKTRPLLETVVAVSGATLALRSTLTLALGGSQALSAATLTFSVPVPLPLATSAAVSSAAMNLSSEVELPLGTVAAQSAATLALGILVLPPETYVDIDGVFDERPNGGLIDESLSGGVVVAHARSGVVAEPARGGLEPGDRGGVIVGDGLRGGDPDRSRGGTFDEAATGGVVLEVPVGGLLPGDRGGAFDQTDDGGTFDQTDDGGTYDDDNRGGDPDEALTGGVFR